MFAATLIILLLASSVASYEENVISGGHSRDFHMIDEDGNDVWKNMIGDWQHSSRQKRSVDDRPSIEEIEKYIDTFRSAFDSSQKYIRKIVNRTAVLTGRIKRAYSIKEKLQRKSENLTDLTDIIGLRLTCQTVNDSLRIANLIEKSTAQFDIVEKKCNGMCPGSGKYNKFGYRRIHYILMLKPEQKPAELQIGTPYTNYWADWNHDIIYKGPKLIAERADVKKYDLELAEYFWKLDEERNHQPVCPEVLQTASTLDILKATLPDADAQKMYEKLGKPLSACFWWNDLRPFVPEHKSPVKSNGRIIHALQPLTTSLLWLCIIRIFV